MRLPLMSETGEVKEVLLDQHIVSAVLLRRWTLRGALLVYDLRYDYLRLRSPRAEGYITGFTRVGTSGFEAKWAAIEQRMPAVFAAVDDGVVFDHPEFVAHLKDFMALHFSRSRTMREVYRRSLEHAMANLIEEGNDLRDPRRLEELFFLRYGLHAAGPGARLAAYEAALKEIGSQLEEGGAFFGERLDAHFGRIREELDRWKLQIGRATEDAEFLISDDPVQTVDSETGRVGVLSGVTIDQADALLLPLGPRHVVSASNKDEYLPIHQAGIRILNSAQLVGAHEKVFMRPESGVEAMVKVWRAEQVDAILGGKARPKEPPQTQDGS